MALESETKSNGSDETAEALEFFDIPALLKYFQDSLLEDEDIQLDSYLDAYKELIKFCNLLGNVFSFVRDEIESKSDILFKLKTHRPDEFNTLKGMVKYEMSNGLLSKKDYVSGCRTLLRLHWGLDFIRNFLKRVHELEPEGKTSSVGRDVYHQTLGSHHAWYVRMVASPAMGFLPTKKALVDKICGGFHETVLERLPEMLDAANEVYNRTETVYKNNDLLKLE